MVDQALAHSVPSELPPYLRYNLFVEMTAQIRRNVIYNVYMFQPARLRKTDEGAQEQQQQEQGGGRGNGGDKPEGSRGSKFAAAKAAEQKQKAAGPMEGGKGEPQPVVAAVQASNSTKSKRGSRKAKASKS
jgi:hypothetical protein